MKVSLNAVKEFTKVDLPIDELVEKIGAQLGAVEEVTDLGKKYQGIIIAKVVSCEPHPNADKLKICTIDDGGITPSVKRDANGSVQVVCGASNVRPAMLVAWLPPGTTVPSTFDKEPFVLEAREIRGQVSNGMLASSKELDLGDSHDGILELDVIISSQRIKPGEIPHVEALHNYREEPNIKPGDDFAKTYGLDDHIIDIENKMFTHRPDLFGQLGVAREIAGILGQAFESSPAYKAPKTSSETNTDSKLLVIQNDLPELVPRFVAQVFENITIAPSPVWMQAYLMRVGLRPINNVVDITNYFMMQFGQPLHAYDYDKVKALDPEADQATLAIRHPQKGEKLTLLSGKTIEPRPEAIMIATGTQAIGLGGVMGGATTEVDADTTTIILECASFDMYSIRRTAMEHGIFTDAVTRFTKGQSPLQNDRVVAMAQDELICDANAMPSEKFDNNNLPEAVRQRDSLYPPVTVSAAFINARLGLKLAAAEMQSLLTNVECKVEVNSDELTVAAPFWRTDIELPEDVVEEVGRLYGYDKLPLTLPLRDLTPAAREPLFDVKASVRTRLSKAGASEILAYSFVPASLLDKVGQDKAKAFEISNALSPDLQYYRMSLMPSLLEKVHPNIKAGYDQFALFELGKTHSLDNKEDEEGLPQEFEFTALVVTADDKLKPAGAPYYQARKYLEALTGAELSFKPISDSMLQYPVVQPYNPARAALVSIKGGDFLGIIGEFKPSVARSLKLPKYTAGFEVDTTVLQSLLTAGPSYSPLLRFPGVNQDITLKVPADLPYEDLYDSVDKQLGANAPDNTVVRLEPVDIYQKADDLDHKQVTFRVSITGTNRTLTDKEVSAVLNAIAETAKITIGAERI